MYRPLFACALIAFVPGLGKSQQPDVAAPTETVVTMRLKAAAAPKPVLKYLLLPELRELQPGNAILGYLKCFSEQNHFFHNKDAVANREKWSEMPLHELPVKELRGYGGVALRRADQAARLDSADWQVLEGMRKEGFSLLVPDLQQMRVLAWALKVRFRGEIADKRFDDAVISAQTMLALSRHAAEHPTLIADLVGIAIATIAVAVVEEMIQQPDCPNLFWALTELPSPFIDLRKGMQGERLLFESELSAIRDDAVMSQAQLDKAVAQVEHVMKLSGRAPAVANIDVRAWLAAKVKDEVGLRFARKRLVEHGLSADKLAQLPPPQIVLLDQKRAFEVRRDDAMKLTNVPYWQAEPLFPELPKADDELLGWLAPSLTKVRIAQARLDQRIGMLRYAEALRLYAAENNGRLPAQLADLKLPLAVDPMTGRPFIYTSGADWAVVRCTPPRGLEKSAVHNIRYQITITK